MLDKEICKKCINKITNYSSVLESAFRWSINDDLSWDEKIVCCPYRGNINKKAWTTIRTDEDVPDYCPFKLEHIMKEDEKNAR